MYYADMIRKKYTFLKLFMLKDFFVLLQWITFPKVLFTEIFYCVKNNVFL